MMKCFVKEIESMAARKRDGGRRGAGCEDIVRSTLMPVAKLPNGNAPNYLLLTVFAYICYNVCRYGRL